MPEFPLDPDLAALTAALGGLSPTVPTLNRDRLLYEAGRRAARPRPGWPIAAGLFAVLSTGLGARLATAPVRVDVVYVTNSQPPSLSGEPQATVPASAVASGSPLNEQRRFESTARGAYLQLRDQVVRFGADSLPATLPAATLPSRPVEEMLGLPRGTLDDANKSRWQHQLSHGDV